MKEILTQFGIDQFDHFLYEFEPLELKWWDLEHLTSMEVEVHQDEKGCLFLNILFSPNIEGIAEKTHVFFTSFFQDTTIGTTLVAKCVLENIEADVKLAFSEEQNAYYTTSFSKSKSILRAILKLQEGKLPIYRFDLNESEATPCKTEIGDTIDHFIAMMHINSEEFTEDNISNYIAQGIDFEGKDYVAELKKDVNSGVKFDFEDEYGVNQKTLDLVVEVIQSYDVK